MIRPSSICSVLSPSLTNYRYAVNATSTDVAIPTFGRARYTMGVTAVNVNRNKEQLASKEAKASVTVY